MVQKETFSKCLRYFCSSAHLILWLAKIFNTCGSALMVPLKIYLWFEFLAHGIIHYNFLFELVKTSSLNWNRTSMKIILMLFLFIFSPLSLPHHLHHHPHHHHQHHHHHHHHHSVLDWATCNFFWYMSCFKQGWMYFTPRNNKYLGLGCFMLLITS